MDNYLSDPILLIITTALSFLKYILIFRFLFEITMVNFYNPISQAIVKITGPILAPLRLFSLNIGRVDLMIILLILVVISFEIILPYLFQTVSLNLIHVAIFSFGLFLKTILNIYFYLIIISAIASWFFAYNNHPLFSLINELCEPLYYPVRNLLPQTPGIDFSPIVLLLLIQITEMIILRPIFELIKYF